MIQIIPYNDNYKEQTIKFILSVLIDEFSYDSIDRPDLQDIPNVYQQDKSNFWLAVSDGKVVGTIAIKNYEYGRGYLKRMYVDKEMRRQGLGKQLLDVLLRFAKKNSYKFIYAGTVKEKVAANHFYKKNGFGKIKKLPEDLPDFGDTIFLKLDLNPNAS